MHVMGRSMWRRGIVARDRSWFMVWSGGEFKVRRSLKRSW